MKNLKIYGYQVKIVYVLFLLFAFMGCKKYFDPPDVFENQKIVKVKKKKVLLIGIDGVAGIDMKAIAPPQLQTILQHSKYSYDGWTDIPVSDAGSWKNIMTGVGVSLHGVVDSTFDVSANDLGHEHDAQAIYPAFIERLQGTAKIKYSAGITSWPALSKNLFAYSDYPIVVANDDAVRDSTLKVLNNNLIDLVVTQFSGANKAGMQYGYDANITEYKNAVLKIDGYLGQLLEAIKARKNYDNEDWLIIITTTHGGTGKTFSGNTKRDRNIFTAYYQANLVKQELAPLPLTDVVNFLNKKVLATLPKADATAYELGTTGDFTIQLKVNLKTLSGSNTVIFSKTNHAYSGVNGWEFMVEGASKCFRVILGNGTGGNSPKVFLVGNVPTEVNKWYSLALKVYTENGKRYARFYQDGKAMGSAAVDITGVVIGNNTSDLILGNISSSLGTHSQSVSQIAFYNTALSDQALRDFVCQQEITNTDTYYNNLIGYWPCNEGLGSVYKNMVPIALGKDLTIATTNNTDFAWTSVGSWICGDDKTKLYLTQNSDISQQIYYWFGVTIDSKWKTNGKVWLSDFEAEFFNK